MSAPLNRPTRSACVSTPKLGGDDAMQIVDHYHARRHIWELAARLFLDDEQGRKRQAAGSTGRGMAIADALPRWPWARPPAPAPFRKRLSLWASPLDRRRRTSWASLALLFAQASPAEVVAAK